MFSQVATVNLSDLEMASSFQKFTLSKDYPIIVFFKDKKDKVDGDARWLKYAIFFLIHFFHGMLWDSSKIKIRVLAVQKYMTKHCNVWDKHNRWWQLLVKSIIIIYKQIMALWISSRVIRYLSKYPNLNFYFSQ